MVDVLCKALSFLAVIFLGYFVKKKGIVDKTFRDSITKIADGSMDDIAKFLDKLNAICEKFEVSLLVTASIKPEDASEGIKRYLA